MRTATATRHRLPDQPRVSYALDPETSSFVIEGYNWARPFSNFFPGIAGKWGVPLWTYYVSRGQAIASVGVRDKDGQLIEFQSFNHAMARVAREGFRTFLRLDGGPVYEPFVRTADPSIQQTMIISAGELVLRERNPALELETEVVFFPLPGLPLAALAREVRVRGLGDRPREVEWLDGAARVLPSGLDQKRIKFVARHVEAMMGVVHLEGAALFRLKQSAEDSERVERISGGNFYLPAAPRKDDRMIVDPELVFGKGMDYDRPWSFERGGLAALLAATPHEDNKTPCAFSARAEPLPARGELRHASVLGYVPRDEDLRPLAKLLADPAFLPGKRQENADVVAEIAGHAFCASASPVFDAYAGQTFLDNVVRGGMPLMLQTGEGPSAFYLYSRQNGDLERDYHHFVLEPTWLSQGTGHYRSVLQNRRTDSWFFPEVEDANLVTFLSLLQLDAYNPLEVNGLSYRVVDEPGLERALKKLVRAAPAREALLATMRRSFTPGALLMRLEREAGAPLDRERTLATVLAFCRENELGGLHEGFWVDHWHYNFDLLETYLMVWPDRLRELLLGRRAYTFFDNPDVVVPRHERSVDAGEGRIRSYGAVWRDPQKEALLAARKEDRHKVRTRHGKGAVYRTRLLVKLLGVVANRLATLDPAGRGVEMEASKPGWNDSMNGLPGMFGSGLSETLELQRAIDFLLSALVRLAPAKGETLAVYEELADFIAGLHTAIKARTQQTRASAQEYWEKSNGLKEKYREATRLGVSGAERAVDYQKLIQFLADGKRLLERLFAARRGEVVSKEGVPFTYFVSDVVKSKPLKKKSRQGYPLVKPLAFETRPVRLFLEGPVHWMKARPADAAEVYRAVKGSALYDRELRMYKACESMEGESHELGRAVGAYPRGWIENESIYLHMEYKYLLEVLRSGQCDAFWKDARTALVPFMDPAVYGRSTLEGASFIVSSAYADPSRHGQAFQPRLSGITCEFLHMWILAAAGEHPFRLDDAGELELGLEPRLPGWLFTTAAGARRYHDPKDGWTEVEVPAAAFAFKLMSRALVVYENPARADTFGPGGVAPVRYRLEYRSGKAATVEGARLPAVHARAVREGKVRRIDVALGR